MKRVFLGILFLLTAGVLFFIFLVRMINHAAIDTKKNPVAQPSYSQREVKIDKAEKPSGKNFDVFKPETKKDEKQQLPNKSLKYKESDKNKPLLM